MDALQPKYTNFIVRIITTTDINILILPIILIIIILIMACILVVISFRKSKQYANQYNGEPTDTFIPPIRENFSKSEYAKIKKSIQAAKENARNVQISPNLNKLRNMTRRMWHLQLRVVLWKNLIIRKRHWFLTICEALIPVCLFLLIAYGRSKIPGLNKREISEVTHSEKSPIIYSSSGINLEETQLYYSPANDFFADLIHRVQVKFQITNNDVQGFNSEDNLLETYAKNNNNSVIAIIFNSAKGSPHLDYTIRTHEPYFSWNTDQLYQNQYDFVPTVGSLYLWMGFLALQKAVDMSFIEKINGTEPDIDIETLEFPYPPYKEDSGMSCIFIHYLPLVTLFSFIFVCPAVLKRVVEEKYSGIKELMKMVGMRTWMLWLGWFIYSILPMIFSVFLMILIMKVDLFQVSYPLIEHADAGVLIVFLLLYCTTAIVSCFFLSTLFKKPALATLVGLLLWILTYFVPKYLLEDWDNVPLTWSFAILLLPNIALHYGYTAVSYYEQREIGLNWTNLHIPGGGGSNEITMLNVYLMLIFDIFFYMILTLYFDRILPGKYGVPDSIFFPLKCGWIKRVLKLLQKNNDVEAIHKSEQLQLREDVEVGQGVHKGIELYELTKNYDQKRVVDKLSMDIYKNRITVLLGHNGAGKTTTMGMITGMIKKTAGHIKMNGKKIESSYDVTDTIGLCPQHNLFFPDLTVEEHLRFFAMLKGRSDEDTKEEISTLLKKLDLVDKANEMAHTLSGGMQRKLCLGMAVIGGSEILILDEPSSGMDPESRRHMWDLLLSWKKTKTILITTHFMEEADALGDWIAIMREGSLRCYGSPMYLKKRFETGYNLNLQINIDPIVQDAVRQIETIISPFKPTLKSVSGGYVVFLLPPGNDYKDLVKRLESKKEDYYIQKVSLTSNSSDQNIKKSSSDASSDLSESETGYNLNIKINRDAIVQYVVRQIEPAIFKFKPTLKSVNGSDVVFLLPFGSDYTDLFKRLESKKEDYYIVNMSCTATTLEDVFLTSNSSDQNIKRSSSDASINSGVSESGKKPCFKLTVKALLFKRATFIRRKFQTYLIPGLIALLFLALCIYLGQGANDYKSKGLPALNMKLGSYGKTTVMFNSSDDPAIQKMKHFYAKLVTNEKSKFMIVDDVSEGIVKEGIDNLPYYKHHMVAAAEFTRKDQGLEAVAMYNNLAWHSAPISLNLVTNTLAKAILGDQYSISMTSHPLDSIVPGASADQLSEEQIGLLWLIIMPLGFLFFLGSFIYFPYVELSTNFTQLQFMCGCPPSLYWMITYVFDFIMYFIFILAMCFITMAWTPFRGVSEFAALLLILVMYGVSGIPCAYLFSRKKSFSGAYALFIILGIMLGVLLTVIVSVLEESGDKGYIAKGDILKKWFLLLCPQFGLTYNGVKFSRKVVQNYNFDHIPALKRLSECHREEPNPCCNDNGPDCQAHKSYMNAIMPDIMYMFLSAGLFIFVVILLQHSYWLKKQFKKIGTSELSRLKEKLSEENTLTVTKLWKSYSHREVVKGIDFTLKRGQCMGILGVNGAGKTTTFRMLSAEEVSDKGDITIDSYDVGDKEYFRRLGYCPQNNALNYSITGREILSTMAMLRGIGDNEKIVDTFLALFELTELADIPCEFYSGGNMRKLSFAAAIIGTPEVILLDEPTNGVDPSAKRKFWSLIKNIKEKANNSFVLTSHSMAECEVLCNDLKIMNDGTIKRAGTIATLRAELNGFDVRLKLKPCDETDGAVSSAEASGEEKLTPINELKRTIQKQYPNADVKDEYPGLLHYYIKTEEGSVKRWSLLFEQFENTKKAFPDLIEDYWISDASLEDVFLDVARENKNVMPVGTKSL